MMKAMQKYMKDPKALEFEPPLDAGLAPIQEVLRTPEERFASLDNFPFAPHYFESRSHAHIRIHYIDEGPRDAKETVLLMHGEPSWCYLYRHMIPLLVTAGYRVLAPDLVGFGKSDKPADRNDYSYERHVDWMSEWFVGIGLQDVTLFAQDWGGLIGLRVVARFPERFVRVCISNTGLPTGTGANKVFKVWAGVVSQQIPEWDDIMSGGCARKLTAKELDAYRAPFPSEKYKGGSRQFPRLVPQFANHGSVEENKGAWRRVFQRWHKPFLTLFGDSDAVSKGGEKIWQQLVPGAKGQPHTIIKRAGHFCQEDQPEELCKHLTAWISANPVQRTVPAMAKL